MRPRAIAVASITALAGACATASAGPPWAPVHNLTSYARGVSAPDLAVRADGTAVAVWSTGVGTRAHVELAVRRPGRGWTSPRAVPGTQGVVEAQVAWSGGRVLVAWTVGRHVLASTGSAGAWTRPLTLHTTAAGVRGTRPGYLQLAANGRGDAVAGWATVDDDLDGTYARQRAQVVTGSAGIWGPVRTLSRGEAAPPEVTLDAQGRATTVWSQRTAGPARVLVAAHGAGGWSAARFLSARGVPTSTPELAGRTDGRLVVAWAEGRAGAQRPALRRWDGGLWSSVSRPPVRRTGSVSWMAVGLARDGTATLGWATGAGAVRVADARAGGWGAVRTLAPRGSVYYGLHLAVSGAGDGVLAWDTWDGRMHRVTASLRRGGLWSAPAAVSPSTVDSGGPAVATLGTGRVLAVWLARPGPSSELARIQARATARGPRRSAAPCRGVT